MRWFPLESNPTVINKFVGKLGLSPTVTVHDVLAPEDWAVDMLPGPPLAFLFLFPMTENQEAWRTTQKANSIDVLKSNTSNVKFFVEQRIGNACGTIGLLHGIGNLPSQSYAPDSWLDRYFSGLVSDAAEGKSPADRLEADGDIQEVHTEACEDGSNANARGDLDQIVNNHFIAFAMGTDNGVYEFDGRKPGPVKHGIVEGGATFAAVAFEAMKGFFARDPTENNFTMLAICDTSGA